MFRSVVGEYGGDFCQQTADSHSERNVKIDQNLPEIRANVEWLVLIRSVGDQRRYYASV